MKRNYTSQKVLVVISLIALSLPAQETPKLATIRLVDGKTGKPMGNERLLVFFGASPEGVRFHDGGSLDLHTDTDGVAALPLNRLHRHIFRYSWTTGPFARILQTTAASVLRMYGNMGAIHRISAER